jgi:hypothetical protein
MIKLKLKRKPEDQNAAATAVKCVFSGNKSIECQQARNHFKYICTLYGIILIAFTPPHSLCSLSLVSRCSSRILRLITTIKQ